jgi:hypothetical protein
MMGTAIDELIRHHPSLKHSVLSALQSTLDKIEQLGQEYEVPADIRSWYLLAPETTLPENGTGDVNMMDAPGDSAQPTQQPDTGSDESGNADDSSPTYHENHIVAFIDILGRVCPSSLDLSFHMLTVCLCSFWKDCFITTSIAKNSSMLLTVSSDWDASLPCLASPTTMPTVSPLIPSFK